jgi:hypothetical protein
MLSEEILSSGSTNLAMAVVKQHQAVVLLDTKGKVF